jgi:CDP-glucose 4,6-dehydratase
MFNNIYKDKKVLVTGNTGFKGAWLSIWLHQLGAKVYGLAEKVPTVPSIFEIGKLDKIVQHHVCDINDLPNTQKVINDIAPDFIFHLAAQPIVKTSYENPVASLATNIMGTAHILESVRNVSWQCTLIMITSDKCYDNVEWEWGYKETDALGGKDPYSASKGGAELVIKTYYESYFKKTDNIKIAAVRAGNVIGGGDWAEARIVPDIFRSWAQGNTVDIRSPQSTRPWQHVLEPLSGYLLCGQVLFENKIPNGLAFNFGPNANQNKTVLELLIALSHQWKGKNIADLYKVYENKDFHEAGLLKLNCDRALMYMQWRPTLEFDETVTFTGEWYNTFYNKPETDMLEYTMQQINEYANFANLRNVAWSK